MLITVTAIAQGLKICL